MSLASQIEGKLCCLCRLLAQFLWKIQVLSSLTAHLKERPTEIDP